jgi:ADP-dependent NAD(P)H-hydrate dehydratase / NAD(P)H-hydrate epimerase
VDLIRRSLGPRRATSHKGDFGHLLVVGGAPGMGGAVRLAAEAALRVGTGRVSLAVHPSQATSLNVGRPELMVHRVSSAVELDTLLAKATVVALGPGLGLSDWSKSMWKACLEQGLPIVVDADGLNLLAEHGPVAESNLILTPHPGEAARLLACSIHAIEQDRVAAIQALQSKYQAPVVLKGAGSLVMDSELQLWVCVQGNPGMASAGMGDLLTGVIAGLLAQGVAANVASRLGVLLHALAGDRAAEAGERGLVASDLLPHLRKLVNLE